MIQASHKMSQVAKSYHALKLVFDTEALAIRDMVFYSWKKVNLVRRAKLRLSQRKYLNYRWSIWRNFVRERKLRELEDLAYDLNRKLVFLMELNNVVASNSLVSSSSKFISSCLLTALLFLPPFGVPSIPLTFHLKKVWKKLLH